jgi:sugar phosphate isomerase/epimerase
MRQAADFFNDAAEICHQRQCCIGLEHNPVGYGCDFVTNVADARELVDMVDHPGFQLHLDSAGIHMCGPDIGEVISEAGKFVHYHISEPMLEPVADGEVDHERAGETLKDIGYSGWVSIEMKLVPDTDTLYRSVARATSCYVEK